MLKLDRSKAVRLLSIAVVACTVTAAVGVGDVARAGVTRPGSTGAVKNPGLHHPVHGLGSTHNPIVRHPPLHGPGSSHNPIVVPSNTLRNLAPPLLMRRCDPPPCPARVRP